MKCSKCGATMEIRTGKFGDFYYCKKSNKNDPHKTVTVKDTAASEVKSSISVVKVSPFGKFDLDDLILQDVYSFGFKNDHIGDLAQFSLGLPSESFDDDHWGNYEP